MIRLIESLHWNHSRFSHTYAQYICGKNGKAHTKPFFFLTKYFQVVVKNYSCPRIEVLTWRWNRNVFMPGYWWHAVIGCINISTVKLNYNLWLFCLRYSVRCFLMVRFTICFHMRLDLSLSSFFFVFFFFSFVIVVVSFFLSVFCFSKILAFACQVKMKLNFSRNNRNSPETLNSKYCIIILITCVAALYLHKHKSDFNNLNSIWKCLLYD